MKKASAFFYFLAATACASSPEGPFDPSVDPRVGASVEKACFGSGPSGRGGAFVEIGDKTAFIVGDARSKYLLAFSPGCGNLGNGAAIPVFTNYGDNCRRVGDTVSLMRGDFRPAGNCVVEQIYEWNEDFGVAPEISEDDDFIETSEGEVSGDD